MLPYVMAREQLGYTATMKRLILIGLIVVAAMAGNFLFIRKETTYKSRLNEAVASITPTTVKDGVVLGCKVTALQRREDYPGVIKFKTVPEIRTIILAQTPAC